MLSIRLFGALEMRLDDELLPRLDSARAESLLGYLLLHQDEAVPRERLAFILWPESTDAQARTNLRHVLHHLRSAAPALSQYIDVRPRTLRWLADGQCWLDVAVFEAAVARGSQDVEVLEEAVRLYRGDLLSACYDEWVLGERERLLQSYLATLRQLAEMLEARGDRARAVRLTEELLRRDALQEDAYRLLMRLYDGLGDRTRAIRAYHACATVLERELGVEPSAATRDLYDALLPPDRAARSQAQRAGGSELVGRTAERTQLAALWRAAEQGQARFVLISGEPGIGKTRLLEDLRAWCTRRGATTAWARAYAAEGALAYGPIVEWLRSPSLQEAMRRLSGAERSALARLLPASHSDASELHSAVAQSPEQQRQQLFDAIARAMRGTDGPLLLVADDLHWFDRESLQFLHYLLRTAADTPLLIAASARPGELVGDHPAVELVSGVRLLERYTGIELERLSRRDTQTLASGLAARAITESEADQLFADTHGNPLFVVEALRAGWHAGQQREAWLSPKLRAVIEVRMAQLSAPARELLGVAATVGREFTADLLSQAIDLDEAAFVRALDELWQRRLIHEQGADAYDFTHDMLREVAYLDLSPMRRRQLHRAVARSLERAHRYDPGPISGQVAAHYDQAGEAEQAIVWYERAAEAALQLYAGPEAIRLLDRALDLLRTLPETPQHGQRELAILELLPAALGWVHGFQSPRFAEVQRRVLELSRGVDIEPHPAVLRWSAIAKLSDNDFAAARQFARRLQLRAETDADVVLRVESEYILGVIAFWLGELNHARSHLQIALDTFRPEHRRTHLARFAQDPEVICLNRLGCTLWFLGFPDAARQACERSLVLAEEVGHAGTRSLALVFASLLALEAGEPGRIREHVANLEALGGGFDQWHTRTHAELLGGYLDVLDGRTTPGLARIRRTIDEAPRLPPAPGHVAMRYRVLLAACEAAGEADEGLAAADQLIAQGEIAGLWQAEAHRMRGEFLAVLGRADEVTPEFERALVIAREQAALALELRVATSLLNFGRRQADRTLVSIATDLLARC